MILGNMKTTTEMFVDKEIKDTAVTIPVYFNDAQRQITQNSDTIPGMKVARIIIERTKDTLISYGMDKTVHELNVLSPCSTLVAEHLTSIFQS